MLDDELSDAERRQARRHIGTCERCSAELASFGRIDSVLASPPAIDCAGALPLLSSRHDRELSLAETLVAEAHIAHCAACRAASSAWAGLDDAISALPVALPSRRVDAAILALGAEKSRPQTGRGIVTGIALRGAVAICLVLAVAVAALQQPARPQIATQTPTVAEQQPVAQLPPITRTQALVASAQQVVLNPKTNTLYVAHPDEGTVGAFNATSLADIATIEVGGRPSALALNEAANTVLVLDTGQKTLTEIDSKTNTVLGTTTLNVAGSPNAIQVDPANGRIVVAVSDPPQSQAATPSGTVVVLDSTSKKLETTRNVPVAARQVVLDEHGQRALLVSEDVVTVVEAATYRPLDQLPGGVAAAFAARGSSTAVLSVAAGSSRVTIAGDQNATLSLFGMPVAIVALPNGGFAVLVDEEGHGRITEIAPDGSPGRSVNVDLVGRELTYNAATGNYAVAGSGGIVFATTTAGQVAVMPPAPTINAQPPTSSNGTAAAPSSAPASAPTSVVPAQTAATERQPNLPQGVTLAWPGTYRFDLVGRAAPEVVGRGHAGHLWFVDAANRLTSVDAVTGAAYTIYELPKDARIRSIEVGSSYVYAIDVAASRVYVVSLPSEQVSVSALPFVKSSAAVAVTPDDRLWFAVADQILTLDPRNGKIEAANIGAYGVGAMTADSAGRVWFSDESQKLIGMYDRATSTVTELALPRRGTLTAMVVDSSGTLWAGSDAGELFAVRGGALVVSAKVRGSVRAFALDPIGTAWFLSADGQQASLGQVRSPGAAKTIPATIAGVWFDARSDAWLADRSSAGFFIAVPEAR